MAESIWDSQLAVVVIQTDRWVEEASDGWHDRQRCRDVATLVVTTAKLLLLVMLN
jgi:hypothetical protein